MLSKNEKEFKNEMFRAYTWALYAYMMLLMAYVFFSRNETNFFYIGFAIVVTIYWDIVV